MTNIFVVQQRRLRPFVQGSDDRSEESHTGPGQHRREASAGIARVKVRIEAYLKPEVFTEVEMRIAAGDGADKADLVRQALHEQCVRRMKNKA